MEPSEFDISIIIPLNHYGKLEELGIYSIRNQLKKNVEILIVINGLEYEQFEKVRNNIGTDKLIKFIYEPENNANSARFKGLHEAKGKYIFYHDADDILLPGTVELLIEYANKNIDCICFNLFRNRIEDDMISSSEIIYNRKKEVLKFWNGSPKKKCYSRYPTHIVNKLFKRELLDNLSVTDAPFFQDWYMSYNMGLKIHSILYSNKLTYIYNNHNCSNSHNANMTLERLFKSLNIYKVTKHNIQKVGNEVLLNRFTSLYFIAWFGRLCYLYRKRKITKRRFHLLRKIAISRVDIFAFSMLSKDFYVAAYYRLLMLSGDNRSISKFN